jgi:multicomponent Na+:H+ antiporter subunit D
MLVFLGAMNGFALTGDLFNLFVFFELMGVAAYALTAFRVEETGPVQGAFNFGVTNSVGAFLILTGIALLYGRFGALNLAQLGNSVTRHGLDGLVLVAFTLLVVGLLVKAAAVPFHFWLADAHAVAPAPVCVLFSGVMVELGVYAVARIYWTVFSGATAAQAGDVRAVLIGLGVLTALVGGVMCFLQRHVKRLLAYSTISHTGVFLIGLGALNAKALGGAALWVLAHGFLKGALFLAAGLLLIEAESVDELELHGKGRTLPVAGLTFGLGAIGLAGLPFLGAFSGHSAVEEGATEIGYGWTAAVLVLSSVLTSGAILRAGARIFLGLGPREDPLLSPEPPERPAADERKPPYLLMRIAIATFLVLGLAVSLVPGLERRAEHAAARLEDRPAYAAAVLHDRRAAHEPPVAATLHATTSSVVYGLISVAGAAALAALALGRKRIGERVWRPLGLVAGPPLAALRTAHSGIVTDYVAWTTFGTAILGGLLALLLR